MNKSEFYNDYKKVRDKAWDILIKNNVSSLPVDVFGLCERMGVKIISYTQATDIIRLYDLTEYTNNNDGFTTIINGHYIIFYDDTVNPKERLRFTVAHELGHIVLGHLLTDNVSCRKGVTIWNRGEAKEPNPSENAANIFASRLLAPACVLWALDIHSADEISKLCGLSKTAAQIRAERMRLLYEREQEWFKKYNKSCFGTSPRERAVLKQFENSIHKNT
ncbi:MAG: ImmA/IrrE family metallo-endopeptidase [Clostridia bacterium]|nr:ImmA/IrrE family metallo-endopeptidase [Clostridia bacterium]